MKKKLCITTVFCACLLACFMIACRPMINPIDPKAENYQGYPTIDTMDDMSLVFPGEDTILYYLDLTWAELLGTEQYHIQVSSSESGFEDSIVYEKADCTENSAVIESLAQGDYFYRIRALQNGEWTSWTDVLSFSAAPLLSAENISPEYGGNIPDMKPLLDWDDAFTVDGVDPAATYQLQIADSAAGLAGAAVIDASASEYQVESDLEIKTNHWRVRAVNEGGTPGIWSGPWSFTVKFNIGDTGPAGGLIFYVDEADEFSWTYLEAAPASTEWDDIEWGAYGTDISGADGTTVGTGEQNTADIVAYLGTGSTYAAQLCDGLSEGGYDDWFLPSKGELNLMYENLYQQGLGGFTYDYYWSSSEFSSNDAWRQYFDTGSQVSSYKYYNTTRVRAVRAY